MSDYTSYSSPQAPQPPQPPEPGPSGQQPADKQRNTIGTVALIVAIVGFIFACIPGALILGWILLPIAFILSIVGLAQSGKKKGTSIAAIILSIVGTIIGILVVIFGIATAIDDAFESDPVEIVENEEGEAAEGVEATTDDPEEDVAEAKDEAEPQDEAQEDEEAELGSRANPVALGETFSSRDWEITLISFNHDATDEVLSANALNDKPEAGHVYGLAEIEVTYIGDDSGIPWLDISVSYVTENGNTRSSEGVAPEPTMMDMDELYEGASSSGNVSFEIPEGDEGMLRFTPGFLGDDVFVAIQ